MVIGDFDIVRMATLPTKANPVLGVDANAVLSASAAVKPLQPIPRWHGQLLEVTHSIQLIKLPPGDPPKRLGADLARRPAVQPIEDVFRPSVAE